MALTNQQSNQVLQAARKLIGKTYADIDCSHFVHEAYGNAGLTYEYAATATFVAAQAGPAGPFELIPSAPWQSADVLLFKGHMGLRDPDGCSVLGTNAECKRLNQRAPLLSSRSGGNRGPDYGIPSWWGSFKVYRWCGLRAGGISRLKQGQLIRPIRTINPTMVSHWKYSQDCASIGGGLTEAARLTVAEICTTPGQMWVRAVIPGSTPPRYLKIAGEEYARNFAPV
jgi:hypothetical protein